MNRKMIRNTLLLIAITISILHISVLAAEEDWTCENCNTVNAAQNNFCGNCGTARPEEYSSWICAECGHENDAAANFCVNCGLKKATKEQNKADDISNTDVKPYTYGQHMLYWEGYTYVTGDEGIYRIDSSNQFDKILGNDSIANGFFAIGEEIYFMKYDTAGERDFLYVYEIEQDECNVLCSARYGSLLVGADEEFVYFLQPSNQSDYNNGKDLIRYDIASDRKETVASGIGTAKFWNGGIVVSGFASDVSPVPLMMLGADGNLGLIGENCSQSFCIGDDTTSLYYIKYRMTSDIAWDGAYICCLDQTGNQELFFIEGSYVTPGICGMVSGNIVVSYYLNGNQQYVQFSTLDGSWGEMELPEEASYISIYYDEYGNPFYYSNYCVYVWKGSEYRKVAEIAADGLMLGVCGNYTFYWRYSLGSHPKLFQTSISY